MCRHGSRSTAGTAHPSHLHFLIRLCMQLASTNQKWLLTIQCACLKEQTVYVTKRHMQGSFEILPSSLTATGAWLSHRDLGNTWLPKPSSLRSEHSRTPQDIPHHSKSGDSWKLWSLESRVGVRSTYTQQTVLQLVLFMWSAGPQNTLSTEKWPDIMQSLSSEHTAVAIMHGPPGAQDTFPFTLIWPPGTNVGSLFAQNSLISWACAS